MFFHPGLFYNIPGWSSGLAKLVNICENSGTFFNFVLFI